MPHELIAVEIAGLAVVATPQVVKLLAHGMEHGVVLVQRSLSDLEKILSRVMRLCLVFASPWQRASDLFTV
jgi:hypothetical protein